MPFFKFKISSIGIYTGFCAVVRFLKSCRIFPLLDFNSSVAASWILTTSAKWDLLTLFSTWGTENNLAEINLESTGGDKRL